MWALSDEPFVGTVSLTASSPKAFWPTVQDIDRDPLSQVSGAFTAHAVRYALATLTVTYYTWAGTLYPGTWAVFNLVRYDYILATQRRFCRQATENVAAS